MKRFNLIFVVSIVMVILFSAFAFGAQITGTTYIGTTPFTTSNNVCIKVASLATQFGAASGHLNGNAQYGTCGGSNLQNCDPSKIYRADSTSNVTDPCDRITATVTSNGSFIGSSWKVQ